MLMHFIALLFFLLLNVDLQLNMRPFIFLIFAFIDFRQREEKREMYK